MTKYTITQEVLSNRYLVLIYAKINNLIRENQDCIYSGKVYRFLEIDLKKKKFSILLLKPELLLKYMKS